MPQVINDLTSNPWVIAEQGEVTTKNIKVAEIKYHEPDDDAAVVELVNKNGHLLARFDDDHREVDHGGWFNGITVDRIDSGYLLLYFAK